MANLDVHVSQGTQGPASAAVILCHGFGVQGDDLAALQAELLHFQSSLAPVRFYFPAAPFPAGNLGLSHGLAWWEIEPQVLMQLQKGNSEALQVYRHQEPSGLAASRSTLQKLLREVTEETGLSVQQMVLGGFSQGATLATDVALHLKEALAGLVILSGSMLTETQWRNLAKARLGLKVFQSHGRQDLLLKYEMAEALHALLRDNALDVEFHAFEGGHTLNAALVEKLAAFIVRCIFR